MDIPDTLTLLALVSAHPTHYVRLVSLRPREGSLNRATFFGHGECAVESPALQWWESYDVTLIPPSDRPPGDRRCWICTKPL